MLTLRNSLAALLVVAAVVGGSPAPAADMPSSVRAEVAKAESYCRDEKGTAKTDAGFAKVVDLNGDGAEDWILDFSRFHCEGTLPPEPFCGSGGCSLTIFLWRSGKEWEKAFDDVVQGYSLKRVDAGVRLDVTVAGNLCGLPDAEVCLERYEAKGNTFRRIGGLR